MLFKKKKVNIDNLTLDQLDKMIVSRPCSIKEEEKTIPSIPQCNLCQKELFLVIPVVELDGRKLYECSGCHERIYI